MHGFSMTTSDRAARQQALAPPGRLARCRALVIGVGAIGRQAALQLAALGLPHLTLVDDDRVEPVNLAAQGYWPEDLGRLKVEATAELCRRMQPTIEVIALPERFRRSTLRERQIGVGAVVFSCVDSIATRRLIWESVHSSAALFVDGRMHGEVLRILASDQPVFDTNYPRTLFSAEEAHLGACTARSTLYAASIAAGLMIHQFARWLRNLPVDADSLFNLLAGELTVPDPLRLLL